jgi:hypothetical protein
MREDLPVNYEAKNDNYVLLLSKTIHENNVPDELIIAMDETNTLFTPQVKRTRCAKGTRRVVRVRVRVRLVRLG